MRPNPREIDVDVRLAVAAKASRAAWRLAAPVLIAAVALASSAVALPSPRLPALTAGARDTREGEAIAQEVWKRVLVRCGPNWVFAPDDHNEPPEVLRRVRFIFASTTDELTPADRLNGVEWQGYFYVNSPVYRTLASSDSETASGSSTGDWGPWQDNFTDSVQAGFRIRKFKGRWQISKFERDEYTPLDTSALKSLRVFCSVPDAPRISR